MRSLRSVLSVLIIIGFASAAQAQDGALRGQILERFDAISKAYEARDVATVRAMTAKDFYWITSFNGGGRSLDDQLQAISEGLFTFELKPLGEMRVDLLDPDVALQQFRADLSGAYAGEPLPSLISVTLIWVRQDGQWKQRLWQETPIED